MSESDLSVASISETANKVNFASSNVEIVASSELYQNAHEKLPGRGNKIFFRTVVNDKTVNSFIDCGSTVSLCKKDYVANFKLRTYKPAVPVNMWGMFGNKESSFDVSLVTLHWNESDILFPAYVVESLPHDADVLIGMDQIGKAIGIEVPLSETGANPSLSFFDNQGKKVVLALVRDAGGSTLSNELPGGKDKPETNLVLAQAESEVISASSAEAREAGIFKPCIAESSGKELSGQLLMLNLERELVRRTITALNQELLEVCGLEEELNALAKSNHVRKARRRVKQRMAQLRPKSHLLELLEKFQVECKKLKKKYKSKVAKHKKSVARKVRKAENEKLKKVLSKLGRYTMPSPNQFKSLIPQKGGLKPVNLVESVCFLDQLDHIVSTRVRKEEDLRKQAEDLYASIFSDTDEECIRDDIPRSFREEFINLTIITAQRTVDDDTANTIADWRAKVSEGDVDADEYHILTTDEILAKNDVLQDYPTVLVTDESEIRFGQATIHGERVEFDIELTEEYQNRPATSKPRVKPYPMKKPLRDLLKSTFTEMERAGVGKLNPIDFEPEFVTPSFFTRNKEKWRLVNDYKALNAVSKDMFYPLPRIDYIFENLRGKKYFSVIDLKSGYYQFPLSERAKRLMATITPEGIWRFDCLSFGPKNGPTFFQKNMERVFTNGLGSYVFVFIDDIVIFSDDFEEHCEHLRLVLEALKECNLQANMSKCRFFLKQFKLLGKIVTSEGIATDPALVS
jgi:hypothetical protein